MLKKPNQLSKEIINQIQQLDNTSLKVLLEELLNQIMKTERDIYLENNQLCCCILYKYIDKE